MSSGHGTAIDENDGHDMMNQAHLGQDLHRPPQGKNNLWYKYTNSETVIVFVHGILSDSSSCWLSTKSPTPVYWPELVATDDRFDNVSIYLGGYYTATDATIYGIRPASNELFSALKRIETRAQERGVLPPIAKKNIIFVCHSTGGIVVRHILVNYYNDFLQKKIGLVLIASPSSGSPWANWLRFLTSLYGNEALQQLEEHHWTTRELHAQFKDLINEHKIPQLSGIEAYENHFIFHRKWLPDKFVVVTEESAGKYFGAPKLLRQTDHFSSVKPDGFDHPAHELLVDFYHDFVRASTNGPDKRPQDSSGAASTAPRENATSRPADLLKPSADILQALPEIDPQLSFVGREDLLRDFNAALKGILSNPIANEQEASGTEVRLIWLDGPGGMGKSSFLRRACLEATINSTPELKVGLVDFDVFKPDWHRPAQPRLTDPRDLFAAIAYRIANLFGTEVLSSYWQMRATVDGAWAQHVQLHRQLDDALQHIRIGDAKDLQNQSDGMHHPFAKRDAAQAERVRWVKTYLEEKGLWSNDENETRDNIGELQSSMRHFDQPFEGIYSKFVHNFAADARHEVVQPCLLLADTLQQCLRSLCHSSPLVLALDTCEDIPLRIESWMRYLLTPLLNGQFKLLLLVGSQHRPLAWLEDVDRVRFRNAHLSLSREGRFSLADIRQAVLLAGINLEESPDLPIKLMRITAGMPVALAPMIDLYKEDPTMGLDELDEGQADDPDDNRAKETATRLVAKRLIRRLEGQPDERKSFRDIMALTIMLHTDLEVLARFWAPADPRVKLRELEERYTLLAGGNIHPDIRRFVRAHWRQEPPAQLASVVSGLLGIVDSTTAEETPGSERRVNLQIERLNLLLWQAGEDAISEAARCLVASAVAEVSAGEIIDLLLELRPVKRRWRDVQTLLKRNRFVSVEYWSAEMTSWVVSQSRDWPEMDKINLNLLSAINNVEEEKFEEAVALFEKCLEYFSVNPPLPLQDTVVESYTRAVVALGQQRVDVAERAVRLLERIGVKRDDDWDSDYYWLLHDAALYNEAEEYCRRASKDESENEEPLVFLAHILGVHLDRLEEAVGLLTRAVESKPDEINLNYFLGDLYERQEKYLEAEKAFKKTLEGVGSKDRSRVLATLADLYLRNMSRRADAHAVLDEAVKSAKNNDDAHRAISEVYLLDDDLERAETHARRAVELDSEISNVHHLGEVLLRRGKWDEAYKNITLWLTKTSGSWIREHWSSAVTVLRNLVAQGRASEFGMLLQGRDDKVLQSLGLALTAPNSETEDELIGELRRQLTTNDIDTSKLTWPNRNVPQGARVLG
jgi:tetratricopeptide (TPR) repeat protein